MASKVARRASRSKWQSRSVHSNFVAIPCRKLCRVAVVIAEFDKVGDKVIDKVSGSKYVMRFVDRSNGVFSQKLNEFRDAALFLSSEMVMDVPAEIILPELVVVFGAAADDVIERVQAEVFRVAQMHTQSLMINAAAQCPNGVD